MATHNDIIFQLALTHTPQIGCVVAKKMIEHLGTAEAVFKAKESSLAMLEGIGTVRARAIKSFNDFSACEEELSFIEQYKIEPLFLTDARYPKRLLQCYDSPSMLFYKGQADLNTAKTLSIIGTRHHTDYGKNCAEKIIRELAAQKLLIISGMAFGIDTLAHKGAVKNGLPTVGVLAHGLQTIYPADNTPLARQMVTEGGGLLTEFWSGTKPDKHNFPTRNRIVAGMADATLVIETDLRGGSMITAELANNYNRDVFALPGKINDPKSKGCNYLIRQNKAALVTSAQDILEMMNWLPHPEKKKVIQRELFIELTADEKTILEQLQQKDSFQIDDLYSKTSLSSSAIAAAILSLELQGILEALPGKTFRLV